MSLALAAAACGVRPRQATRQSGSRTLYATAQVRHGAEDLRDGETVILTLADKAILDERGGRLLEEDDELENVTLVGALVG